VWGLGSSLGPLCPPYAFSEIVCIGCRLDFYV
jgi:hypothetical protein